MGDITVLMEFPTRHDGEETAGAEDMDEALEASAESRGHTRGRTAAGAAKQAERMRRRQQNKALKAMEHAD